MTDEIKKEFNIPENHTLEQISFLLKGDRKGREDVEYVYNQLDENGEIIASYTEIQSTSNYPPFATRISVTRHEK